MPLNAAVARQQWMRYTYARDTGHLQFVDKARKCEEFFAGMEKQWDPNDLAKLTEQRRPALTINKILGTLSNIMGEQIDLRTEIAYRARFGAPSGNADCLTKLFRYIGDTNQLSWARSDMFADGAITSRGFLDVRMNFNRSVTGDVEITNLNPKNVIPDPDAMEYDPDKWNDVITTKWLTCDDIEYLYNKEDADALRQRASSTWAYGFDSIDRMRDRFAGSGPIGLYITEDIKNVARMIRIVDRQYRKLAKMKYFINVKSGDRKEIPHTWDRNRIAQLVSEMQGQIVVDEHVGHKIRWTVTADDFVLFDDWSPYKHFTVVPYFPYFRYGTTIGLVENLISPQELLNKTTSQELHVINTTANSGWVVKKGAIKNMTNDELEERGAQTGLVVEVENNVETDLKKIQPNQIPQGLADLSRKSESYIKSVSMRGDAQQGMARADTSAAQMDASNQYGDVGLRKPLDNLKRSDFILARNVLDLIQEFYTDPRIALITNSGISGEQEEIKINWPDPNTGELMNDVTMGEYETSVIATPEKQTLEDSQFQQAALMKEKLGIQIPDEFMIQNSNLIGKTDLIKALKEQANSAQAQMAEQVKLLGAQLQVANLRAEGARLEADGLLKNAKAAHTMAQTQEIAGADPTKDKEMQLEEQKHNQEMEHEGQKLAMKHEEHRMDLAHSQEEHQQDMALKQQQSEDDARLKKAQAIMTMRQSAAQPAGKQPAKKAA